MTAPRYHVVMALESESQGELERAGARVSYSGVGKVNAALCIAQVLASYPARERPVILNFGSVGSHRFATGALVCCTQFFQRDMDCTAFGAARGETLFDAEPLLIAGAHLLPGLPVAVCGTGDNIETKRSGETSLYDVVDMEAYAFAKACARAGATFCSVKFVTDGSDDAVVHDWKANLARAAKAFGEIYARLIAA